jgi:preprotein translocase subunit SecG
MTVIPLLAAGYIIKIVAAVWFICALALILIILVQKGRGGGLSAAFGGGMASGILGSKTGDFLTWVTIVLVSVFITLSVVLAKIHQPADSDLRPGQPIRREQPRSPELPPSIDNIGAEASETNEPSDANSLDG